MFSLIELPFFKDDLFVRKHACPLLPLSHTLSVFSMNNHFMNITISAAVHLAQFLITESIWQTVEDSESFGLTQGTHLALPVKRGH